MKYFGIAHCPYCKKRINLLRIWSLKKKGEYLCPRCSGISNIYQSPLIYLLAIIAVVAGFLIYFFEIYAWDSLSFYTPLKVIIPFAIFFILSLFMIYLDKIVINRIKRDKNGRLFDETGCEYKMKMGKLVPLKKKEAYEVDYSKQEKNVINTSDNISGDIYKQRFNYLFDDDYEKQLSEEYQVSQDKGKKLFDEEEN